MLATAAVPGMDGHRIRLRHEGVAYALRYGEPLIFTTPNLADNKGPMLSVAQGNGPDFLSDDGSAVVMPTQNDLNRSLANDPVGQSIAFDITMRLFFVHLLGIRPEAVGRDKLESGRQVREWNSDGCACTGHSFGIFGPIQAFRAPIEAQGRGSLHPHILVWLVRWASIKLMELLTRDPEEFANRCRQWQQATIDAIASVQQSDVQSVMHLFGRDPKDSAFLEVPLTKTQDADFTPARQACDKAYPGSCTLEAPFLREEDDLWKNFPTSLTHDTKEAYGYTTRLTGHPCATMPSYRRATHGVQKRVKQSETSTIVKKTHKEAVKEIMAGQDANISQATAFESAFAHDVYRMVLTCHVHKCNASCFKYSNKAKGKYQICRHRFYHIVELNQGAGKQARELEIVAENSKVPRPKQQIKCTRIRYKGKRLRNVFEVEDNQDTPMFGRVSTWQRNPNEGQTNYTALACLRCNLDVQDLRRIIPRLTAKDPVLVERLPSIGEQRLSPAPNWGWMNATPQLESSITHTPVTDWPGLFAKLSDRPEQENNKVRGLIKKLSQKMFLDAHNAGYYIHEYTTKLAPTMEMFMTKLRDGLQKLQDDWQQQKLQQKAEPLAADGRRVKQKTLPQKAMSVLMRVRAVYEASSYRSASELVFPILFGHLCYASHSCWTVFVQKALYQCTVSYDNAFPSEINQQYTAPPDGERVSCMVNGRNITLPDTWSRLTNEDDTIVIVNPEGEAFLSEKEAILSYLNIKKANNELDASDWIAMFDHYKTSGDVEEKKPDGGVCTGSQYDDWLYRGTHPLVKDMCLYVYSIWIYRAEISRSSLGTQVTLSFDPSYVLAEMYIQRIATEPRVPRIDGCQIWSTDLESEREQAHKLLSILLRPTRMTAELTLSPEEPDLYADFFDKDAAAGVRYQKAWEKYYENVEPMAQKCFQHCLHHTCWPSLWETQEAHDLLNASLAGEPPATVRANAMSMAMYHAHVVVETATNFKGIGLARVTKVPTQVKLDEDVPEASEEQIEYTYIHMYIHMHSCTHTQTHTHRQTD